MTWQRVAIIGHGRSAEGRGWGRQIDGCDRVIRMWDCDWQEAGDYGSRYDYGVVNAHPKTVKPFMRTRVRQPATWLIYDLGALDLFCDLAPVLVMDPTGWLPLAARLQATTTGKPFTLTRGAATAMYALTKWKVDVVLVGFDIVRAGRVPDRPYSDAFNAQAVRRYGPGSSREAGFAPGTERTLTHDFTVERMMIATAAECAGRSAMYAEEIW